MTKKLNHYLELKYPVVVSEGAEEGKVYFEAEIPELPGCGSFGETVEEALSRLQTAKELWMKARQKRGLPIPEPISEEYFSGKFLLRITPALHRKLAAAAKRIDVSLNQYIRNTLEANVSLAEILERLSKLERKLDNIDTALNAPKSVVPATVAYSSGENSLSWFRSAAVLPPILVCNPERDVLLRKVDHGEAV